MLTPGLFHDSGGNQASLQMFLIVSTCFLYLVAAGLISRGIWFLQNNTWTHESGGDSAETGAGPGSYDIRQSVWHVNCCNPLMNGGGGWGIFNAILGWTNSATYGSVIGYNLYWLVILIWFVGLRQTERHGRVPLLEPLLRRWRARKAPEHESDMSMSSPGTPTEDKTECSDGHLRVSEEPA